MKNFAAMRAHDRCVGESIDKTLCIYGDERVGGHDAPFIYGCLCTYVSRAIAQRSLARTGVSVYMYAYALSGPRTRALIRAEVKVRSFMYEIIYRCQLNWRIIGAN